MVTFMCYHCDKTLTKPQVDKHVKTQCRKPPSLICIDCKKMFTTNHVDHISCLSEKQLYWGPYANGKKPPTQQNEQNQNGNQNENQTQSNWRGWRKALDHYVKEQQSTEIRLNDAKQKLVDQFLKEFPDYSKEDAENLFDESIKQSKKYNIEYIGFVVKKVKQE